MFPTLAVLVTVSIFSFTFLRFFVGSVFATTYTVSKVADTNDGTCDSDCSLREAITAANANAGADTINFNISGSGVHTIAPTSTLPSITSPVTINGYSQTGSSVNTATAPNALNGTLTIEINGTSAGSSSGLTFESGSSGSTVKGLVINRFAVDGIMLNSSSVTVSGCYVGTDTTGASDLGNTSNGITVPTSSNTIGGTTSGARNVISGNGGNGISVYTGTSNTIQGNYVGINAAGTAAIGNTGNAVSIGTNNNTIGGTVSGAGNVISGSSTTNSFGIYISGGFGAVTSGNVVQGNYIGTDASGNTGSGLGNYIGILILADAQNNLIGGTASGAGNIIAGSTTNGILVATYFGFTPVDNSILGNSIHSNGSSSSQLGINIADAQLGTDSGVHILDAGDTDTGANDYMNFPVITSITPSSQLTITYNLDINDSESGATGYRVEFFANDSADVSGNGEGQTYLGSDSISGDVSGRTIVLDIPASIAGKVQYITATTTMTDTSSDGFGSTSEFSAYYPGTTMSPLATVTSGGPAPAMPGKPSCEIDSSLTAPDLFQIDIVGIEATLHFAPPPVYFDKIFISYGEQEKAEGYGAEYSQGRSTGALTYTVGYLKPLTPYYFKVRAGNGCHPGVWSPIVQTKSSSKTNATLLKFFPQWRMDLWNAVGTTKGL